MRTEPRVVHVSPVPFGELGYYGGGERYPVELARAMASLTPTTYVSFAGTAVRARDGDLETRILPTRRLLHGSALNPVSEQLLPVLARADVVHLHQWENLSTHLGVVLAKLLGKRVFVTDHGGWTRNQGRRLRLHRLVDAMLDVSDFAGSFYPWFGARHTIFGGVDTSWFAPDPAVPRGDHATFVGRLRPAKGVDVLIESLDDDQELRVVGRPYDEAFLLHLRRLAEGKKVTFVLGADDDEVRREYQQARVVVLPSLHDPVGAPPAPKAELLGLTLLEAMACGTPVICTRTGGMPEVVTPGVTGLVVEPHDRAGLRDAVRRLCVPGDEWDGFSAAARAHVLDSFTWRRVAERCLDDYRSAGSRGAP